jgi:hypothetical protein
MEVAVKATGYVGACRTNSADVKNIAHDEQPDCLFRPLLMADEKQRIEAKLMET